MFEESRWSLKIEQSKNANGDGIPQRYTIRLEYSIIHKNTHNDV